MMISSDAPMMRSSLPRRCTANTPDSCTRSWVKLYLVRLMVIRGSSGTMPPADADRDMSPLARPSATVVIAVGNGRRPLSVASAAFRSSGMSTPSARFVDRSGTAVRQVVGGQLRNREPEPAGQHLRDGVVESHPGVGGRQVAGDPGVGLADQRGGDDELLQHLEALEIDERAAGARLVARHRGLAVGPAREWL